MCIRDRTQPTVVPAPRGPKRVREAPARCPPRPPNAAHRGPKHPKRPQPAEAPGTALSHETSSQFNQ
eukprot:1612579-Pyramimonas_sp.AAC.1